MKKSIFPQSSLTSGGQILGIQRVAFSEVALAPNPKHYYLRIEDRAKIILTLCGVDTPCHSPIE